MFRYDADLLAALAALGIVPRPDTRPEKVKEAVNDLYRYELRQLRDRLMRKEIPKAGYSDRVIELRRRYWMLSLSLQRWAEEEPERGTKP
jgi:hypothetical protein